MKTRSFIVMAFILLMVYTAYGQYLSTYTGAELDEVVLKVVSVTNGTGQANKAVILDANRDVDNIHYLTVDSLIVTGGTRSSDRLVKMDSSGNLAETDLVDWVTSSSDSMIIVTDDTDGTITLSLPQDIDTSASVLFRFITASTQVAIGDTTTGDVDAPLYFADDGSLTAEYIKWDDGDGEFHVSGDTDFLTNSIFTSGDIGATGSRITKGWFAAAEITSAVGLTIGGAQITSGALSDVASVGMLDEAEEVSGAWIFDNNTSAITIGTGDAGIDYRILFNGEDHDGTITYDEDNDRLDCNNDFDAIGDLTAATIASDGALSGTTITGTGKLSTTVTTEQFRLSYDATNYMTVVILDDGHTTFSTIDPGGAEADINFAPDGNVGINTAAPSVALDVTGAIKASTTVSAANYGSDGSISDAKLLVLDDGALTEILVGGGAGVIPVWTTASGTGAPVRADSPTFTTQITTPDIEVTDDVLLADGAVIGITGNEVITFNAAGSINFSGASVDVDGAFTATSVTSDANVAGLTYGSDSSISDAELLVLDDGATTELLVGGGAGSAPVWTTAIGTGAPVRAGSPSFTTKITTPDIEVTDDILMATGGVIGITGNEIITFDAGGSINFSGCTVDIDGAFTAGAITSDSGISGAKITGSQEANFTNNVSAAIFGAIATDADVVLAFNAVTSQGSITYMEDEDRFDFNHDVDVIREFTAGTITSDAVVSGTMITNSILQSTTLGSGAATFVVIANCIELTGDGATNTLGTITGAGIGVYVIEFVDGLITVTDTDAGTANTINLLGTATNLTSADNTTLMLLYNGTSFLEVSRSVN